MLYLTCHSCPGKREKATHRHTLAHTNAITPDTRSLAILHANQEQKATKPWTHAWRWGRRGCWSWRPRCWWQRRCTTPSAPDAGAEWPGWGRSPQHLRSCCAPPPCPADRRRRGRVNRKPWSFFLLDRNRISRGWNGILRFRIKVMEAALRI